MHFSAYHENSVDCVKRNEFQYEDPSTDKNISINVLMAEVERILMEKLEFEYWDKPKLISFFFGIFGLSKIQCKDQDPTIFYRIILRK